MYKLRSNPDSFCPDTAGILFKSDQIRIRSTLTLNWWYLSIFPLLPPFIASTIGVYIDVYIGVVSFFCYMFQALLENILHFHEHSMHIYFKNLKKCFR